MGKTIVVGVDDILGLDHLVGTYILKGLLIETKCRSIKRKTLDAEVLLEIESN